MFEGMYMVSKILVVDDEPDFEALILQKFRRKIRKNDFEFFFARNGFEALEQLKANGDIDMILTDINMPQMDGLTLLEELLKLPCLTKAVVVSAYGDMDNIRTAMNRGAFDFITKPIDFRDLELTIDKTLSELLILQKGRKAREVLSAMQQEMELAGRLQQSILPHSYPECREVSVCAQMVPAKDIGGDFYDFFVIDDDHLGFIIADVSGKGVTAAIFMGVSRTLLRFTALQGTSVDKVFSHVNNLLCVDNDLCMFVTAIYAILNVKTGELKYANGGHDSPMKIAVDGSIEILPRTKGIALGVMEGVEFEAGRVMLAPGELLYFFTDGMLDAENEAHEFYEVRRLIDFLDGQDQLTPTSLVKGAYKSVTDFVGNGPQFDDMTQLVIQYQPTE
ncbi:MAG: SpoIIE family protein phosphatase [Desulfobacteraceae bacterium]|nr:SpoIIE family protein phosphatase [Desulfobacteraceae bacterium]